MENALLPTEDKMSDREILNQPQKETEFLINKIFNLNVDI